METLWEEKMQDAEMFLSPESFFFMSPYRSFTTSGCFRRLTQPVAGADAPESDFQQALTQAFADAKAAGIDKPVLVGAIPFDTAQPSALFIPQESTPFSRTQKQHAAPYAAAVPPMNIAARREIPEQQAFMSMVSEGAAATATPQVDKIVLSRLIELDTDVKVNTGALLERLIAQNPASFNFHVPLPDGGVLLGASPEQVCVAAEIGMEHNLGLTCDPVAGQVQVPCIERNAIASVKAINAARMAMRRTSEPRVSLDKVIETMYETGKDMNAKYRETSRGGLAIKVQCD